MKPLPPHLPKKEKTNVSASTKQSLFYFFSCAFISIVASLSTVFVALSWIVPRAVPQVQFYNFPHETNNKTDPTLDPSVVVNIMERQVLLYDKRTLLSNAWYPTESALSTGVFLTSDGWVVFPLTPTLLDKNTVSSLQVVDNRGAVFNLQNPIIDKNFHLLYAKIKGDGFHFVSFSQPDALKVSTHVLAKRSGQYDIFTLDSLQKNTEFNPSAEIWKSAYLFRSPVSDAGLLFTEKGELLGVNSSNGIIPGFYIENSLRSLLSSQLLSYKAFPWKGQMVDQGIQNGFLKNITGFFVTDVLGDKNKTEVKVGDVIVKVAGVDVTRTNLPQLLLQNSETVSLEIIRDGSILQKTLPKQIISF